MSTIIVTMLDILKDKKHFEEENARYLEKFGMKYHPEVMESYARAAAYGQVLHEIKTLLKSEIQQQVEESERLGGLL